LSRVVLHAFFSGCSSEEIYRTKKVKTHHPFRVSDDELYLDFGGLGMPTVFLHAFFQAIRRWKYIGPRGRKATAP
jgi:hypothetical protein